MQDLGLKLIAYGIPALLELAALAAFLWSLYVGAALATGAA